MTHALMPIDIAVLKPYIESHPVGIAWLVAAIACGTIELAGATRRRAEATRRDAGSLIVIRLCVIPGVIVVALAPTIAPAAAMHPILPFVIAGLMIFCAGEALRIWSKVALGRYFTYTVMTSPDQPVITAGPYRFLRHPSYLGILLIAIGAGAGSANWLGLFALALATLVGLVYRITVEERALGLELGDKYRDYAAHHRRLIPFVW